MKFKASEPSFMRDNRFQIGVLDVVQIVFIILKFLKLIDWGWGRVLSPLWISFIFALIAVFVKEIIGEDDDNEV